MGRPAGFVTPLAIRQKISASLCARHSGTDPVNKKTAWQPPDEYVPMYDDLRAKLNSTEAKRLVLDHIAIIERRAKRAKELAT